MGLPPGLEAGSTVQFQEPEIYNSKFLQKQISIFHQCEFKKQTCDGDTSYSGTAACWPLLVLQAPVFTSAVRGPNLWRLIVVINSMFSNSDQSEAFNSLGCVCWFLHAVTRGHYKHLQHTENRHHTPPPPHTHTRRAAADPEEHSCGI